MTGSAPPQPAAPDRPWWNPPPARFAGELFVLAVLIAAAAEAEDDRPIDDLPAPANTATNVIDLGANFDRNVLEMGRNSFSFMGTAAPAGRVRPAKRIAGRPADPLDIAKIRGISGEQFARIDALCGLTERQRRKLQLAVEVDTRRTAEAIEAVRERYRDMRMEPGGAEWNTRVQEWQKDVESCRTLLDGFCDGDSLLMKALPTTLDADQYARFVAERQASIDCLWRALVAGVLVDFDDALGLDDEQHGKLEGLLLAAQPPLRINDRLKIRAAQFAPQFVGLALARIDDAQLAGVVSPRQAKYLRQFANNNRGMQQNLESMGLLRKGP